MQIEYEYEKVINLSRFQTVEYFTNPHEWKKWFMRSNTWDPNFRASYEHLEGKPGQPGAITKFRQTTTWPTTPYRGGGTKTTEIIQTIIKNDLPYEYVVTFEYKGIKQTSYSIFQEEASNVTRWINRNEVDLSELSKLSRFFMKGGFPKQTRLIMRRFKKHAQRFYAHQMRVEDRMAK